MEIRSPSVIRDNDYGSDSLYTCGYSSMRLDSRQYMLKWACYFMNTHRNWPAKKGPRRAVMTKRTSKIRAIKGEMRQRRTAPDNWARRPNFERYLFLGPCIVGHSLNPREPGGLRQIKKKYIAERNDSESERHRNTVHFICGFCQIATPCTYHRWRKNIAANSTSQEATT